MKKKIISQKTEKMKVFALVMAIQFLIMIPRYSAKTREKRFVPFFFFGEDGCRNVVDCLGSGNQLFPYRLNFNPITAWDRLKSHYDGNNGWSNQEIRNFRKWRQTIRKLQLKREMKDQIHRQKMRLLRSRIQRAQTYLDLYKAANHSLVRSVWGQIKTGFSCFFSDPSSLQIIS